MLVYERVIPKKCGSLYERAQRDSSYRSPLWMQKEERTLGLWNKQKKVYKKVAERLDRDLFHFYLRRSDRDVKTSHRKSLTLESIAARLAGAQNYRFRLTGALRRTPIDCWSLFDCSWGLWKGADDMFFRPRCSLERRHVWLIKLPLIPLLVANCQAWEAPGPTKILPSTLDLHMEQEGTGVVVENVT